ncbi:chemotaxis protein CheD [Anaerobium acetethylicum]|uniref:Probable chemoreceptor glutamine deamidase CheD n=1 Tax=Anaerobium acetethylicum TaxID=1619234 RepID=A0A1D3TQL2_9FIRM|nr:chemotaxis protein CheD [Anaerobium acetethylicum]SCP95904.1 chemotaxis protein CheD [Anaerobium acetethylicum]
MNEMIKVGMADYKVCPYPEAITTLGLGSCVGIALYDPVSRVAGLAHVMLPDSTKISNNRNKAKFADTGITGLVEAMVESGAVKRRLVAKIAGGAQMFAFSRQSDMMKIGLRNVEATKMKLRELGIAVLAEDIGDNYGRTIEFHSASGELKVKSVGRPPKSI